MAGLQLKVAKPCPVEWDSMAGGERVRFCSLCRKNVYNVANLSEGAVRDLLARNGGGACLRLFRREDGTVLTKDCPAGQHRWRQELQRAALWLAGATAFLGVLSLPTDPQGHVPYDHPWRHLPLLGRFLNRFDPVGPPPARVSAPKHPYVVGFADQNH
jgi:hypothetical protein